MAKKNRPTLSQQFSDFTSRDAPFDGDPLIQKSEHNAVTIDLFDSALMKIDNEQSINSPSSTFNVDFDTDDLVNVDTTGSAGDLFTMTVANLQTGQEGRISIAKKTNDKFNFSNASIANLRFDNTQLPLADQEGTAGMNIFVKNIGGTLFAYTDIVYKFNHSITGTGTQDKTLATVGGLYNLNLLTSRKSQGSFVQIDARPLPTNLSVSLTNTNVLLTDQNEIKFDGSITTVSSGAVASIVELGILPSGMEPNRIVTFYAHTNGGVDTNTVQISIDTGGIITALSSHLESPSTTINITNVTIPQNV
jgi:hypothetical protein